MQQQRRQQCYYLGGEGSSYCGPQICSRCQQQVYGSGVFQLYDVFLGPEFSDNPDLVDAGGGV